MLKQAEFYGIGRIRLIKDYTGKVPQCDLKKYETLKNIELPQLQNNLQQAKTELEVENAQKQFLMKKLELNNMFPYKMIRKFGAGGFGGIWLAEKDGKEVVVKM